MKLRLLRKLMVIHKDKTVGYAAQKLNHLDAIAKVMMGERYYAK